MLYSAVVKDKQTHETTIIENKEYLTKAAFIADLKGNGYAVNPYKIKESNLFEYILNNTNCENEEWQYINKIPEYGESISDIIWNGMNKNSEKRDIKFKQSIEIRNNNHQQYLQDMGITEKQFQEMVIESKRKKETK